MMQSLVSWGILGRDVEEEHEETVFVGTLAVGGMWGGAGAQHVAGRGTDVLPRVKLPRVCPGECAARQPA